MVSEVDLDHIFGDLLRPIVAKKVYLDNAFFYDVRGVPDKALVLNYLGLSAFLEYSTSPH